MPRYRIDLTHIENAYLPHFWKLQQDTSEVQVLRGTRGSGKSYYWPSNLLYDTFRYWNDWQFKFLVLRKWSQHCQTSVVPQIQEVINNWGIPRDLYDFNKTEKTFTFLNGSQIACMGANEPERLKSIPGVTKIVFEEATDFTDTDYATISAILRGNYPDFVNFQRLLCFNPISKNNWIYKRFYEDGDIPGVKYDFSTFKGNPFNGPDYEKRLLELCGNNQYLIDVNINGKWGVESGLIYHPDQWKIIDGSQLNLESEPIYGLDFGWNDPKVIVQVNKINDTTFYLKELFYEKECKITDMISRMNILIPDKDCYHYGDGASPEHIDDIFNADFNIDAADKSPGSVKAGIEFCKRFNFLIDEQSENLLREIKTYTWKTDKDDRVLDKPNDMNDHCMDAFRYAIFTHYFDSMEGWEMKTYR